MVTKFWVVSFQGYFDDLFETQQFIITPACGIANYITLSNGISCMLFLTETVCESLNVDLFSFHYLSILLVE